MKPKIRMTVDDLSYIVKLLQREQQYGSATGSLIITMETHPNGRAYLQIEQPCAYAECNSHYERISEDRKDYEKRINAE